MAPCPTDKHACITDDNGIKWRPLVLQWRKNGGFDLENFDCIRNSQSTPCTVGADPPRNEQDYVNLNDFDQYAIDGKYHLKLQWDFGESIEWKQVETIFENNKVQTVSDLKTNNHKNHTELIFSGVSIAKQSQRDLQLFDGSTNQEVRWYLKAKPGFE